MKIVYSRNADPIGVQGDALFSALIRRHEAYEAQATEKNMRRLFKNPAKYRDKAVEQAIKREEYRINKEIADGKVVTPEEREWRVLNAEVYTATGGARVGRDGNLFVPPLAGTPAGQAEIHSRYATKTPGRIYRDGKRLGNHADIDVLVKERKLIERTPYLQEGELGKTVKKQCQDEHEYMDLASGYDPSTSRQRFGKKDAASLKRNMQNPITVSGVTYNKEF